MIATWMLYALGLAVAVSGVALAVEYALRLYGRSTRWLWAMSLGAALAVPVLAWLLAPVPTVTPMSFLVGAPAAADFAAPLSAAPAAPATLPLASRLAALEGRLDGVLPWLWLATSLLAALGLAWSYVRLRRQRAGWREVEVDGVPVLLSEGAGPAVVGLRRGRIVVPAWVLEEPEGRRRLILAHEAEHLAAGDVRLLTGALAALVAAPWNPLVWWQIRRLRLAAEVDCDARVLRRGADLRGYAGLLLDVGMRFGEGGALAAFAEPRSLLARRLRALTAPLPRRRGWRVLLGGLGALAVAGAAWSAPRPERPARVVAAAPDIEPVSAVAPVLPALVTPAAMVQDTPPPFEPPATPYDVAPELTNREEVRAALVASYPPLLKAAGVGGRIDVWLNVTAMGITQAARVRVSSGRAELDSAAVKVAHQMRFTPGRKQGQAVPVWITVPIVFKTTDGAAPGGAPGGYARTSGDQYARVPSDTPPAVHRDMQNSPYDVEPKIVNRDEVNALAQRLLTPELRAQNPGNTTVLTRIDEQGRVSDTRIQDRAGVPAADSAALAVVRAMRFTPAQYQGKPVAIWVLLPKPQPEPPREQILAGPTFTPYTVAPELANRDEVRLALIKEYPPELKATGANGQVQIWLLLDEQGGVLRSSVKKSAGNEQFDSAAVRVGRMMHFKPAFNRDKPVMVWVALPIIFRTTPGPAYAMPRYDYTGLPKPDSRFGIPGLPEGLNPPSPGVTEDAARAYVKDYPRDVQLSGPTWVWVTVTADGLASGFTVAKSSGNARADSVAVALARQMHWQPATDAQHATVTTTVAMPFPAPPRTQPTPQPRDTSPRAQAPETAPGTRSAALGAVVASTFVPVFGRH